MCSMFSESTNCLNHREENDMPHISGCVNISSDHLLLSWKADAAGLCSLVGTWSLLYSYKVTKGYKL